MIKHVIRCTLVVLALNFCAYADHKIENVETPIVQIKQEHWLHHGNQKLDLAKLKYEIYQISKTLPDICYTKDLANLIVETIAVETNLGQVDYLRHDHKTKNYGLGQFVLSTAKHILKAKKKDKKTYNALMKYYDNSMNLKDNVRKNVRFTIALQLEYYHMCDKNLLSKISTVRERAKVWKKHYNTYQGSGSIEQYIACVRKRLRHS